MPTHKSVSTYRSGKQNCAQSLYCGFQDLLQVPGETIESARKLGGGKAEEGRCGALHAALDLSRHEETKDLLRSRFEELAGSQSCREIKSRKLLSCVQCVELAATVLSENEHLKH
jgi:hypothetical protein